MSGVALGGGGGGGGQGSGGGGGPGNDPAKSAQGDEENKKKEEKTKEKSEREAKKEARKKSQDLVSAQKAMREDVDERSVLDVLHGKGSASAFAESRKKDSRKLDRDKQRIEKIIAHKQKKGQDTSGEEEMLEAIGTASQEIEEELKGPSFRGGGRVG